MDLKNAAANAARSLMTADPAEIARQAARHARLEKTDLDKLAKTTGLTHAIRTRRMPLDRSGKRGG